VNSTNLYLISYHFQVTATYWSSYQFWLLFNSFILGQSLGSGLRNLALKN